MKPTFKSGDRLWVSRIVTKLSEPKVGDVVVLRDPRDGRLVLKRIERVTVKGCFVYGDNKESSTDSKIFGPVTKERIVGKVLLKYRSTETFRKN